MKKLMLLIATAGLLSACNQGSNQGGTGTDTSTTSGSGSSTSPGTYQRTDTNSQSAVPQSDSTRRDLGTSGNTGGNTAPASGNGTTDNSATR
jgi:hypothetical protein